MGMKKFLKGLKAKMEPSGSPAAAAVKKKRLAESVDEVFQKIDALSTVNEVKRYEARYDYSDLAALFWENRDLALKAPDTLAQRKARAKCQYICRYTPLGKLLRSIYKTFKKRS